MSDCKIHGGELDYRACSKCEGEEGHFDSKKDFILCAGCEGEGGKFMCYECAIDVLEEIYRITSSEVNEEINRIAERGLYP